MAAAIHAYAQSVQRFKADVDVSTLCLKERASTID